MSGSSDARRPLRIRIITLSDRASRGEYADRSGPAVRRCAEVILAGPRWDVSFSLEILPDDAPRLRAALEAAIAGGADVVFTTGGTGIGPRDVTPDVIRPMLDKELPGVMEAIRVKFGATVPSAVLSRSIAGVAGRTLVYALPGSARAVEEYMGEIGRSLDHALDMLFGRDTH
jgi:molybdopterin adenylyltransferase